eukprot:TRINITY_DN10056_c0_g1_i1.p2 TRINITY_DN10056_c0_g1~~TRINITY_DN10056_c0_g1_i1.p2  ORF type:complete len:170 (-),score=20.93 TRINITY_DN10056_c0_g1_i1:577-1086(-)
MLSLKFLSGWDRRTDLDLRRGAVVLTVSLVVIGVTRSLFRSYREKAVARQLHDIATRKRKERDEHLYGRETQILDAAAIRLGLKQDHAKRVRILKMSVRELLEALENREFTVEETICSFCLQALKVCGPHTTINAVTETFFEEALEQGAIKAVKTFVLSKVFQSRSKTI